MAQAKRSLGQRFVMHSADVSQQAGQPTSRQKRFGLVGFPMAVVGETLFVWELRLIMPLEVAIAMMLAMFLHPDWDWEPIVRASIVHVYAKAADSIIDATRKSWRLD